MSQRPSSSRAPSSSGPSSKPPASKAPASKAPKSVRVQSALPSHMVSAYPSMIQEEDEDFDDAPAKSKAPPKSILKSVKPPKSSLTQSVQPTMLQRDSKSKVASSAPKSSKPPQSAYPSMPAQSRVSSSAPRSSMPSQSVKPTMLARDSKSKMSSSAPKSSVPSGSIRGTVLGRDGGSVRSTAHLDPSVFSTRSLLTTPEDVKMASKMSQFKSMTPTQQKKQQSWFDGYAKDSKCCPENNEWVRADSGMICSEGGHGMTDEMIEEGLGAICAMPKGCKGDWSKRCGPYYQVADKGPKGEAMWKFNKGIKFPGVVPPKEK